MQDAIAKSSHAGEKELPGRKNGRIGTSQYPNLQENMLAKIEIKPEERDTRSVTKYKPLVIYRETEPLEKIRLTTESFIGKGKKKPDVFLFTTGNAAMRKVRAGFATNFFGCAGFGILDHPGYPSVEAGVKAALASRAEIVVICSSDEEYEHVTPGICHALKAKNPEILVVVAGYPALFAESLKAAGVDDFIHLRSNIEETLVKYQEKLGII